MSEHALSVIMSGRWLSVLVALGIEALFGGRRMLGRVPGPDGFIAPLDAFLARRLDRPGRGDAALAVRGLLAVLAVAAGGAVLGSALALWAAGSVIGAGFYILTLGFIMGCRPASDASLAIAFRLGETAQKSREDRMAGEARYAAARWAVERLANRYGDGFWANLFAFIGFGLPGLFAFRALSMTCARAAPKGVFASLSPYDRMTAFIYQALTFIPGAIAAFFLSLAALFVPGTKVIAPWRPFMGPQAGAFRIRIWAVNSFAHMLRLALPGAPGDRPGPRWLGPEDGIARARAKDVRRALLLFWVAWLTGFGAVAAGALLSL